MSVAMPKADGLVCFQILSQGKQIPDIIDVRSIETVQTANKKSKACVEIFLGDTERGFPNLQDIGFSLDSVIEISAGYDSKTTRIFLGRIKVAGLDITSSAPPILSLECESTELSPAPSDNRVPDFEIMYGADILKIKADKSEGRMSSTVIVPGWASIETGQSIGLMGLGSSFSQNLDVLGVTQKIANGEWTTELSLAKTSK